MLGTISAQDVHVLCLDFCTVAAAHQDIRPKLLREPNKQNCHSTIAGASFGLENDLHSKARYATHKITPALHKCLSGIIF